MPSYILHALALTAALAACGIAAPTEGLAQTSDAPCGSDPTTGVPYQCATPGPGETIESTCLATGRVDVCVAYYKNSCEVRGFQVACRLYRIGQSCSGGDTQTCTYFQTLMRANRACVLDKDASACGYLQQQGF